MAWILSISGKVSDSNLNLNGNRWKYFIIETFTRNILFDECNGGNIIFHDLTTTVPTTSSTAITTSSTLTSSSTTTATTTDFTTNQQFTTMKITKKAPLEWEEKMENARGCLLDYLASLGKLQSISDWVQSTTIESETIESATMETVVYLRTVEGTTAWTAANIATNQFNGIEYKNLPLVFLVISYLL